MAKVLVVGADTVAGGNVAARLAKCHPVAVLPLETSVAIAGCTPLEGSAAQRPERVLTSVPSPPEWIVVCGTAAVSSWERRSPVDAEFARRWAAAARAIDADLAYVSTDGVFDGPRLFHVEGDPTASTVEARAAQLAEQAVLAEHPAALVLRTHVFGWSPTGRGAIESLLEAIVNGDGVTLPRGRHATPVHAAHVAEVLLAARAAGLSGVWHAAGAERIDRPDFAQRLALAADEPRPATRTAPGEAVSRETSLSSSALAARLGFAPPLVDEGLALLFAEQEDGFLDRLVGTHPHEPAALVA